MISRNKKTNYNFLICEINMLHNLSDDPLIFLSSATIVAKHETNMLILSINLLIPKLSCIIIQASNQSNGNGFLISDFNNFSMFSRASRLFSNALFVFLKSGKIRDEES